MDNPVYIIGHKNPDADAICSAVAYAAFKKAKGENNFRAARCGNSNSRIDAIFQRFGLKLPRFVGDVTPRVRDVMVPNALTVRPGQTCAEALEILERHDIRSLPVVNEDGRLEGTISIFKLGQFFLPTKNDTKSMRRVRSSLAAITRSLNANALYLHAPNQVEELFVRVGAMDVRSFGRWASLQGIGNEQSIVVVGDREDIQRRSVELGIRLVIVTGGLAVSAEILALAERRGVSFIVSPYDSATTAWIVRTAGLLEGIYSPNAVTFEPDEKLHHVAKRVAPDNTPIFAVVDENRRLLGVFSKTDLLKPIRTQLVLVDHNELSQAVDGAEQVRILEIIDHHRLGNPPSQQPIRFINEPVGSTCTIVASLFRQEHLTPDPKIAGLMMCGIISDTLLLQSPTTTPKDRQILYWLADIAGEKPEDLAHLMFTSGSVILNSKPEGVVKSDLKAYNEAGSTFTVSQIEELGFENFWAHEQELRAALKAAREAGAYDFSALFVTDIYTQNSLLMVSASDEEFLKTISYSTVGQKDIFELPGVVSRKKQLLPYLTQLVNKADISS